MPCAPRLTELLVPCGRYVLTEVLCHSAGGPEVITAEGFDDTKLGVLPEQWVAFMGCVKRAAQQVWPGKPLIVTSLEALVEEVKPEICLGLVAHGAAEGARKLLRDAGYSHVHTTAALLECAGDGPKALELLKSGWSLPTPDTLNVARCPFEPAVTMINGNGAATDGDGTAATAAAAASTVDASTASAANGTALTLPAPIANAVKTMAASGMAAEAIASVMKLDAAHVEATLTASPKPSAPASALPEAIAKAVRTMAASGMAAEAIAPVMKLDVADVQQALAAALALPADVSDGTAATVGGNCPFGFDRPKATTTPERSVAAASVDMSDGAGAAGGRCPFGFDKKAAPPTTTNANPALLVETLRERFSARMGKKDGHVAGRVLSNDKQRTLDDLLVEPAELCCPVTLMLLTDPVIASDGCVYERAAIRIIIEQGKLSPLTLTPLSPELYPAATQSAKVLAFLAERAAALMRFANTYGEDLVVPQDKRLGQPQKPSLAEVKAVLMRELGLDGTIKQVIDGAIEQLGIDVPDEKLVDKGVACLDAIGFGAAASNGAGGVEKLTNWDKRVAAAPVKDASRAQAGRKQKRERQEGVEALMKAAAALEARKMVSNALDRAQLYISSLIAVGGGPETMKLASDFYALTDAMERPVSIDVLAIAAPLRSVELKLRMMTGNEVTVLVPVTATVAQVIDAAVSKTGATKDKGRTLVHARKQLPHSSSLAQHNVVEGTLLTLILTPPVLAEGVATQARTVAEIIRDAALQGKPEGEERAYGVVKGVLNLHNLCGSNNEVKTLYARCGGIFGVAGFVDRCMDAWMADPTLNANDAVANWHERAQRCGFKFLVTQLMGYLCGGPQVYTGRDMATSHKHLNISEEEWGSFIDGLHDVCDELGLPQQEVEDVTAVIESMRADCIILDGEAPPANPGHPTPAGDSLYARCGGVYPLALVCDRLVDALLSDEKVKIKLDAERTMASLKYCFTELCCSLAGGPETMTAPSVAATTLGVNPSDFVKLLGSVVPSADHLETPELGVELAQMLYGAMHLILKEPPKWHERTWEHEDAAPTKTQQEWQILVDEIGAKVGLPVFYVPDRKCGFLLSMEQSADEAKREERRKVCVA